MGRDQAEELIFIAWLAMAAFDKPHDVGTIFYVVMAIISWVQAVRGRPGRT